LTASGMGSTSGIPDKSIDMVINHRSMMEMNWHTINNYFNHIHRITKIGGIFHCVNRFQKTSVGEDIRIKKYPFDEYWKILIIAVKSEPGTYPGITIAAHQIRTEIQRVIYIKFTSTLVVNHHNQSFCSVLHHPVQ